jgi:phosphate starvation-inducible PhoH-like protein
MNTTIIKEFRLSKKRSNAVRREYDQPSQKSHQTFYQKHEDSNTINFNPQRQRKPVTLVPKTVNQETYILALQNEDTDVVVAGGPAGTGKTYLATLAAIQAYRNKEVSRIVICRPAVSIEGEEHGFLPGDLTAKLAPWVRPVLDTLREFYAIKEIESMIAEEVIEFAPLGMIRGRTFKNTFLILDEAQNASPVQLKSLLTRIGKDSKFVLNGDIHQADRYDANNGLKDLLAKLKAQPIKGVDVCEFTVRDVQRHRLIGEFLNLYGE